MTRVSGNQRKDPTVFFVIASEGTETEPAYFELINKLLMQSPMGRLIKVEALRRTDTNSSFLSVIKQLDDYKRKYSLKVGDELWCLIDRDRIPEKNAADASRQCSQKNYEFCLSSPCFEIWLLLHLKDLTDFSSEELRELLNNPKKNTSKTILEHSLNEACKGNFGKTYHKNALPLEFLNYLSIALRRAFRHKFEDKHWTFNDFCTRAHELVQRIFKVEPPDYQFPFSPKI